MKSEQELLLRIKALVLQHGGAQVLAESIENEWNQIITSKHFPKRIEKTYTSYTEIELFYLKHNYPKNPVRFIARKIGRSSMSVQNKIYDLKKRNPDFFII